MLLASLGMVPGLPQSGDIPSRCDAPKWQVLHDDRHDDEIFDVTTNGHANNKNKNNQITPTMTDCCHTLSPQEGSLQHQRRHSCGSAQTLPSHQRTACRHPCHTDWLPAANNTTVLRASLFSGPTEAGGLTTGMLVLLMLTVQYKVLQVP